MGWSKCSSDASGGTPSEEPTTVQQSNAAPSQQTISTVPTDNGDMGIVSDVDALGNCTISVVNNGSSPVGIASVVRFATAVTGTLSAVTTQVLRDTSLLVAGNITVSPQITVNGYLDCEIIFELAKPVKVRVIVSRLSGTVFNIIYRRVW